VRSNAFPACPEGTRAITTTTEGEQAQQNPAALFSHPTAQVPSTNTGQGNRQPHYENLFQEPAIPTHRDTVD
jgi:hypothetical protein